MRRLLVVLLGLVVLGADGAAAWMHFDKEVQPAMVKAAKTALAREQLGRVKVLMNGRDALIGGVVPTVTARDRALAIVARIEGVRSVAVYDGPPTEQGDDVVTPLAIEAGGPVGPTIVAPASVLDLNMVWDGKQLKLGGQMPGEGAAAALVAEARRAFGAGQVIGGIASVGGELPAGAGEAASGLMQALRLMRSGTAGLSAGDVTLSGTVADEATQKAVMSALASRIGAGFETDYTINTVPPVIDAPDADAASLAGGVDEADAVAGTVAAPDVAADAVETAPIAQDAAADDALAAADAAPETPEVATSLVDAAAAPAGDDVPVAPAPVAGPLTHAQCQAALDALVEGERRIEFRGWYHFAAADLDKIAQAAALMQRCPTAKIMVEAYYDEYIEPDKGMRVTTKRATLVQEKLVELGVEASRLDSRGMGYQNSKYPNAPESQRALNRRVEFRVEGER